jgi:hypothetical protein
MTCICPHANTAQGLIRSGVHYGCQVHRPKMVDAVTVVDAVVSGTDPTFDIRRKQANLCDAVMMRVVELEEESKRLADIAKKLRAAVVANT